MYVQFKVYTFVQSAKTNHNVEEVFFSIARDIKQRLSETENKSEVNMEVLFGMILRCESGPLLMKCICLVSIATVYNQDESRGWSWWRWASCTQVSLLWLNACNCKVQRLRAVMDLLWWKCISHPQRFFCFGYALLLGLFHWKRLNWVLLLDLITSSRHCRVHIFSVLTLNVR